RVLWFSALAPWVVAAMVWALVQATTAPAGGPADDRGGGRAEPPAEPRDTGAAPARQTAAKRPDWAVILARLDHRRAQAYAANDPDRLRSVYVPGSAVLRNDLAMLRAYRARGVRLTGVRLRLIQVALVARRGPTARLRVVDWLDRPVAHTPEGTVRLPRDRATERLIVLRNAADGWRIAAVRPA